MNDKLKLSDVLRAKRYEKKLTQEKAAEILDISARHLQELESGRALPGFKTVCKLSKAYGINFADFAENDEDIV